ncbi:MAG: motility-associated protein [Verrucomicrobiota bacterium]|nr:motility-associated protein [Verrucomicrobiota bacterium]
MNENQNTFDLTDSILRVLGIIGFFTAVIFGFVIEGGNVITLVHPAEIFIVVGTIFFRLLCTHRSKFLAYLPKALLALVRKPVANREYCQISDNARGYAAAGGGMAVILSLICTMSNLDDPESVGLRVAAAMSGVFVAMLLSQGLFVYLRYSFSENASR